MIVMEISPPLKLNPNVPQKFCRVCASTFTTFKPVLETVPFLLEPPPGTGLTLCFHQGPTIIILPLWILGTGFSILHQVPRLERENEGSIIIAVARSI
jgi:hypothetical protein